MSAALLMAVVATAGATTMMLMQLQSGPSCASRHCLQLHFI